MRDKWPYVIFAGSTNGLQDSCLIILIIISVPGGTSGGMVGGVPF